MLANYLSPQAYQLLQVERLRRQARMDAPTDCRGWLPAMYPRLFSIPFGEHHAEFWEWVWGITEDAEPPPFVAIWPRGGGKSTGAEGAVVAVGHRRVRHYIWYVRETQEQADRSVENIAAMLEAENLPRYDPQLADRALSKYGHSRGWRRNRLRTASGLTVDAMGLDTAKRGGKVEERRPEMIIFDDIDGKQDTLATTTKKEEIITHDILPAGALGNLAALFIQNLIIPEGVAARLAGIATQEADYLINRIVSGPFPAIKDVAYDQDDTGRHYISAGTPIWEGQNLSIAQLQMDQMGFTAFRREVQQEVELTGGMYDNVEFRHCERHEIPGLVRTVVWVDPAVTATDQSDSMGIQADGISNKGILYRLYSWEGITSPEDALRRAIDIAVEVKAQHVGVETDQGGDTWYSVYNKVAEELRRTGKLKYQAIPPMVEEKAGAGHGPKTHRGSQMLVDYELGKVVHVIGTHTRLEISLRRFPRKPLDLADAAYWAWWDLRKAVSLPKKQAEQKSKWNAQDASGGSRWKRY